MSTFNDHRSIACGAAGRFLDAVQSTSKVTLQSLLDKMFAHSQGLSYTNPHIVDRPPEISWRPTNRKEKITDLPPSLNVRLWRERASVGIAVHCQIRVVVPQGFRLTRGFQKGHIEF